ncbi:MAG: hypothetical protein KAQ94_09130 [Arcobacteraceae bacterium]|nr:hypothetical protein [Arcobacteraceae bacterium]
MEKLILYFKANKSGLDYDLGRVEFTVKFGVDERISYRDFKAGKWEDKFIKKIAKYMVFVDGEWCELG